MMGGWSLEVEYNKGEDKQNKMNGLLSINSLEGAEELRE